MLKRAEDVTLFNQPAQKGELLFSARGYRRLSSPEGVCCDFRPGRIADECDHHVRRSKVVACCTKGFRHAVVLLRRGANG